MLAVLGLATLMSITPAPAIEAAPAVEADPAIYFIRDEDTTIFLLSHLSHPQPAGVQWFNGSVRRAFANIDELVVEKLPVDSSPPLPRSCPPPRAG